MNYIETLNYIHSLGAFSHKASLERMTEVCKRLGKPQNDFKCIHIAGTNGKGSVNTFISSVLKLAGYKVGAFVSPYIVDFCERIQINDEYISRDDLRRLSQKVIDTKVDLTEFEFITAVGFLYFSENKIDVAVLETGLGGRFDATNVINSPLVSVITKIGLDHTSILGETIEQIAAEKCGIIKNNKVVTSYNQPQKAFETICFNSPKVITPNKNDLSNVKISVSGNSFCYKGESYKTNLGGDYQIENALIAIETLKNCELKISNTDIKLGLEKAFIPARLEVVSKNPFVVVDGAHNPDGADVLCEVLKEYENITAVIGVMRDKNYREVLAKTLPFCKRVICVRPNVPRALDVDELSKEALRYCDNVLALNNIEDVLSQLDNNPTFIFGSLYLASEIRTLIIP